MAYQRASASFEIECYIGDAPSPITDQLAVEEPLQINVSFGKTDARVTKPVAITMRTPTPGHDIELAVGFLFSEGIIQSAADIEASIYTGPPPSAPGFHNTVTVELKPGVQVDIARLERHFFTNSSCGVCGRTTVAALQTLCPFPITADFQVSSTILHVLPSRLRTSQDLFGRTGGLHAAALFDTSGKLVAMREDVGRHNALDKIIGAQFVAGNVPLSNSLLLVSGRASYELLQKTIMAGIPLIAAVGAPSSLAVELARKFNVTLVGFLRNNRFNVYSGEARIAGKAEPVASARE